jgi:hypothetical protein
MKANDKVIYVTETPVSFKNGIWENETVQFDVRVMAVAEGYAMVRRPRCMPFVCSIKDLHKEE